MSYISFFFGFVPMISVMVIVGAVAALGLGFPWILGLMTGLMLNGISLTVVVILMLQMI